MSGLPPTGTRVWIGLDPGTVRCGLAAADDSATLASPLGSVPTEPRATLAQRALELLAHRQPLALVCGLPLNERGAESNATAIARVIGELIAAAWGVELCFFDERFSSREALQRYAEVQELEGRGRGNTLAVKRFGKDKREQLKSSGQLDALAAAAILQGFLDSRQS